MSKSISDPISDSSTTMNAVASSSRHVNAVAGPSRPRADYVTSASSPAIFASSAPASKVIITQPTPQRSSHNHSLSMRYQPLLANYSSKSTSADPSPANHLPNLVRPLPRTPPSSHLLNGKPTGVILPTFATSSLSGIPVGATIKRPRTTPGIITNLPTTRAGTKTHSTAVTFSPSDKASSWTTRQLDMGTLPISSSAAGRARSQSRATKRDRSLDSYNPSSTTMVLPLGTRYPSPVGAHTSRPSSRTRPPRSLPSPTVGNARPVRHAATMDYRPAAHSASGALSLQTHIVDASYESAAELNGRQNYTRSQPPSPRAGPLKLRTRPTPPSSPPMSWIVTPQPGPSKGPLSSMSSSTTTTTGTDLTAFSPYSAFSPSTTPPTTASAVMEECEDACSVDAPMHFHPLESFTDDADSLADANPPLTPVEVFIDDMDCSTLSRSPSPIRYARPDSRGNLSSSDDEGGAGPSSSSSSDTDDDRASPGLARRRQLRAYRMSYRPREGGEPPHIPYVRRSPSPAPIPVVDTGKAAEKAKKKKKARSYFGDYIGGGAGASLSIPTTRASSPERMSRSRQPRKLASAVSLALEEVRNKSGGGSGSGQYHLSASSASPIRTRKPGTFPVGAQPPLDDEVLDIRRTSPVRQGSWTGTDEVVGPDTGSSQTSSARSSAKLGWVKTLTRRRSEVLDDVDRVSGGSSGTGFQAGSVSQLGNASAPGGDFAASVSSGDRHGPIYAQPRAQYHHHQRVNSRELENHLLASSGRGLGLGGGEVDPDAASEREVAQLHMQQQPETYSIGCFPTTTGSSSNNPRPRLSDPSTFSSVSSRTGGSSISIPMPGSPFTAFGIISRNKKTPKHTPTPSTSMAGMPRSIASSIS